MEEFADYVLSFYGPGGIYDIGATIDNILIAIGIRLERHKDIPFGSDSCDRELVRDIILEMV